MWDTFDRNTLQATKECTSERSRPRCGSPSEETPKNIEESRAAVLAGNRDPYRDLSRRTRALLGRDKKYVWSHAEEVDGHFNDNDLRALKNLHSKQQTAALCQTWTNTLE